MQPLKVLHLITDSAGISGAERVLLGLAERADRSRWSLTLGTVRAPGPLTRALEATGWPTFALGVEHWSQVPAGALRLVGLVQALAPDVIHTHLSASAAIGAFAARATGTPLVQTRHYTDQVSRNHSGGRLALDRWAARRCRGIAAVSEAGARHLVEVEGVPRERVEVIDNGADWDRLSAIDPAGAREHLRELGVGDGPLVGCAASFHPVKGHRHLVAAFARVHARCPAARLVLLGSNIVGGREEQAVREQVAGLGLAAQVHFLGHRGDASDLMPGFAVYAQPSLEEGFGLAVVEAMSSRRPVVVSDVGGMRLTVEHEVSGLRVPVADPEALGAAILRLLDDPALAARLGAAGSARARERYSLRRVLDDYDRFSRRVLA